MKPLHPLIALTLVLSLSACTTHHGDARLSHDRGLIAVAVNYLTFPPVPIGQTGTTHYKVRNLPWTIYPDNLVMEIPPDEADNRRHDQPWRNCRLHVTIESLDGKPILEKSIDFSKDWKGGAYFRNSTHTQIKFAIQESAWNLKNYPVLPDTTSYRIAIQVLQPSQRPSDKLSIEAPTVEH